MSGGDRGASVVAFRSPLESAALPWPERGTATLIPAHADYLAARAIKRQAAKAGGFRSEPDGMIIPYYDPVAGDFVAGFGRKRFIPARVYGGRETKFMQPPGAPPRLYFWPAPRLTDWLRDPARELFLVEGETRAAAIGQHGHFTIAVGGVWNWLRRTEDGESEPIEDFDLIAWKGRRVSLVFDADVATKGNVQMAILRLARVLEDRGAVVLVVIVPDLGDGKTGADDFVAARGIGAFLALPRRSLGEPEFESWGLRDQAHLTDAGNADRFALAYADRLRYVHGLERWIEWDGARWRADGTDHATQLAVRSARAMLREAVALIDPARRDPLMRWALRSESAASIAATLKLARSTPPLPTTAEQLDRHPFLLAVRNGAVDLRTGELLVARPEWLITKQAPVTYDPAARCPEFLAFLGRTFRGRPEVVAYLRRAIGYALTGDTREQVFFICWGSGSNGKGTLNRVLKALLGELHVESDISTWAQRSEHRAGGTREDLLALRGARFVAVEEPSRGFKLDEAFIKTMTGQDEISARPIYGKQVTFTPECKIFFFTNYKPIMAGDDYAMWRRVHFIPFLERFEGKAKIDDLGARLAAELPGVLNWAIEGCLEWQRDGLRPPAEILAATEEYRREQDRFGQFLEDMTEAGAESWEATDALYVAYERWCTDNGVKFPIVKTHFHEPLRAHGFEPAVKKINGTKRRGWKGLRLTADGRRRAVAKF